MQEDNKNGLPFGINLAFDGISFEYSLAQSLLRLDFGNKFLIVFGAVRIVDHLCLRAEWRFLSIEIYASEYATSNSD